MGFGLSVTFEDVTSGLTVLNETFHFLLMRTSLHGIEAQQASTYFHPHMFEPKLEAKLHQKLHQTSVLKPVNFPWLHKTVSTGMCVCAPHTIRTFYPLCSLSHAPQTALASVWLYKEYVSKRHPGSEIISHPHQDLLNVTWYQLQLYLAATENNPS